MTVASNTYSRIIAWMKIILPLTALALLSTLFLISRTIDPSRSVSITQLDLKQRARDQGATEPSFAGVTSEGDEIFFAAERVRPVVGNTDRLTAERVVAAIKLVSGVVIDITSDQAFMDHSELNARLQDNVHIKTSTGYTATTERLDARLDTFFAESPGPVDASGPFGSFSAGHMILNNNPESKRPELIFTGGVKLIYEPAKAGE